MLNLTITDNDIFELEREFGGKLTFNERRKDTLKNYDDVQACPGSGKTTLVAAKLILLAKKWTEKYKGICVLTHTNVAKDEILMRLQEHPSGHKILSYPHFIGTIQEFVNRYLGLPYLRTTYEFKRFSENCEANAEIYRAEKNGFAMNDLCGKLYRKLNIAAYTDIKRFLGSIHYINLSFDIGFYAEHGNLVPFKAVNNSDTYKLLNELKEQINLSGIFQFRDMYVFAEKILQDNSCIKESLRKRFPFIFIDEMQDTQKFQDDLINQIFDCADVVLQRFGDPDQAIFSGMGGEKPNESYNSADLNAIADSHRFGNDIAHKISGLSYNQLTNLQSIRDEPEANAPHTIFLYDDQSIKLVLPEFGQFVFDYLGRSNAFTENQRKEFKVKAVGAIGRENPNGLTLKHYWGDYDKTKTFKFFKADKLVHIVKKCAEHGTGNISDNYDLLIQGVLDFLRKADRKTKNVENREVYYCKLSLIRELQMRQKYKDFRRLLTSWIIGCFPLEDIWGQQMANLKNLLEFSSLTIHPDALDFIAYDNFLPPEQEEQRCATNIYQCDNGLNIEVSTIHSVKGETHDATLILETKYSHYFDIKESLDFLMEDKKTRPAENYERPTLKASIQASFLKRLYVAASRPRYLLCLALHMDNISNEQIKTLHAKGWQIKRCAVCKRDVKPSVSQPQ